MKEPNPENWLIEEYKLLSQHYFHEDKVFTDLLKTYTVINAMLISFVASNLYSNNQIFGKVIPIIGIIMCISWLSTLIRTREWREYISARIKEIELEMHNIWKSGEKNLFDSEFLPLDIKLMKKWSNKGAKMKWYNFYYTVPYNLLRNIPSSISILSIPIIFLISWSLLLSLEFLDIK